MSEKVKEKKDQKNKIKYIKNAKIICACGNEIETGSTEKEMRVEICSNCHPLYSGKHKFIDTARRVDKFQERMKKAKLMQEKNKKSQKMKKVSSEKKLKKKKSEK